MTAILIDGVLADALDGYRGLDDETAIDGRAVHPLIRVFEAIQ